MAVFLMHYKLNMIDQYSLNDYSMFISFNRYDLEPSSSTNISWSPRIHKVSMDHVLWMKFHDSDQKCNINGFHSLRHLRSGA